MKIVLTIYLFFLSLFSFGQRTLDTIINYNDGFHRERIVLDPNGEKIKEIQFDKKGRVEAISFFKGNKETRTLYYDSTGVKTAEWNDPEIENSKHRNTRNTTLIIVSFSILSLFLLAWKSLGYTEAYFIVAYTTMIFTLISGIFERSLNELNELIGLTIACILVTLPPLLFVLSISNFFRKTEINIFVSIIFTLLSIALSLFFSVVIATAGSGMLG